MRNTGRLVRVDMSTRVVASLNDPADDHRVDVFVRADGIFGFEAYRRGPEDMKGWFPLRRHATRVFATDQEALAQAGAAVARIAAESR
jgi:hypothetical protein